MAQADINELDRTASATYAARTVTLEYSHRAVLGRRALLAGLALFGTRAASCAEPLLGIEEWHSFKLRFLSEDGRIVDNGNNGVSHSEGQGWGLLFAAAARDQASFDLILNWTARSLRRPGDALHAWRYVPTNRPPVADLNNATDGDVFIAAALSHAGRIWRRPDYLQAASAIGRDILRLLLRRVGSLTVLLPGIKGFETSDAIVVNLSYCAFPMMTELAKLVVSEHWDRLQTDGRVLIEQARFGRWSLPPDWLRIGKTDVALSLAPGRPPRFSFDAIRVPLWWSWQNLPFGPAMRSIERFWSAFPPGSVPAWVDLKTDEVAPYPATAGLNAIIRLTQLAAGGSELQIAPTSSGSNYYDAALVLLSQLADQELRAR
jgi:endo-1,4-beta-D-glucanase Y